MGSFVGKKIGYFVGKKLALEVVLISVQGLVNFFYAWDEWGYL